MRVFILILLLLIGHGLTALDASAFKNEPEGFMGMSWGGSVGTLFSKDDFVGFDSDEKSVKYLKISDTASLELDNIKLNGVVYSFYRGTFWKVELDTRLLQAGKLLDAFIGKYGEPSRDTLVSEFNREYIWSGTTTDIILSTSLNFFDRKTVDIATVSIYSKKIKSVIDAAIDHSVAELKLPVDQVNGFRGRKWGSGFDKQFTYLPLEQEPFFEYLIKDDNLEFEGINAQEIRYRFHDNRALQKVELFFSGKQNYIKLKNICFRLFGNISRYEHGKITWIGKNSTVSLSFIVDAKGEWQSRLAYLGFGTQ